MRRLRRYLVRRLWRAVAPRLPVGMHAQLVVAEMMVPELARAGLLETTGRRGFLGRVYQVYWWLVVAAVLLVPTTSAVTSFYFPAVVGVAAAWLFAMPAYAQSLISSWSDFSALRPNPMLLSDFIQRMRQRPIKLPVEFEDDAEVAKASAIFSEELPALIPSALLAIVASLSSRAVAVAVVGSFGMLAGPWLASIQVGWLRGWSPVAVLYAFSAPVIPLLLGSILIPIFGYGYLAYRRADQDHGPEQTHKD